MDKLLDAVPVRFGRTVRDLIKMTLVWDIDERATLDEIMQFVGDEQLARQEAHEAELRHRQSIIDLFERVDADQSGAIDMDEMERCLKEVYGKEFKKVYEIYEKQTETGEITFFKLHLLTVQRPRPGVQGAEECARQRLSSEC